MHFNCFFLLFVFVTAVQACAPVAQDSSPNPNRNRRSVQEFDEEEDNQEVIVTIVSQKPYDPLTIRTNMEILEKSVADYEAKEGIQYDVRTLPRTTKNEGGKFAVEYKLEDDCERVKDFILAAKKNSNEFNYATIKCQENISIL